MHVEREEEREKGGERGGREGERKRRSGRGERGLKLEVCIIICESCISVP